MPLRMDSSHSWNAAEYTCAELDDIRRQVVVYLKAVLRNIQRYLVTRRYLTV